MSTFRVSAADVAEFAEASGDVNPLHIDTAYARKTNFGGPVAHGALVVIHALGALPASSLVLPIRGITARFHGAVVPERDYEVVLESGDETHLRLRIEDHGHRIADVAAEFGADDRDSPPPVLGERRAEPAVRRLTELRHGELLTVDYRSDPEDYDALLGRTGARRGGVGRAQAVLLGWASFVAGMEVPGRQALVSSIEVAVDDGVAGGRPSVTITAVDPRRGLVTLEAVLPGHGRARLAVAARDEAPDPDITAIRDLAGHRSLTGSVAVVTGGSRGLGAAVVQALAVRGAEVYVTHRQNGEELERLVSALGDDGARLNFVRCDAADADDNRRLAEHVRAAAGRIDLLVLNAFPPFQPLLGERAAAVRGQEYVDHAIEVVRQPLTALGPLVTTGTGRVALVSSSAVSEPKRGWEHYAEAKRQSEALIERFVRDRPDVGAAVARPPRLRTAFSATFGDGDRGQPVEPAAVRLLDHAAAVPAGVVDVAAEQARAKVAVTATFTTDPLAAPLRTWARHLGLAVDVEFAPYAQVFQQLLDPDNLLGSVRSGCAVVLVRLDDWAGVDEERTLAEFSAAVRGFAARRRVPLVVQLCPSPSAPDGDPREERVTAALAGLPGVHVLGVYAWDGGSNVGDPHDPARLRIAHIPYTDDGCAALAAGIARTVHALLAKPFKVLVLDCDNTLWQGVAGEDGPDALDLPPACLAVQRWAIGLRERGTVLALASKNDPATVDEVFRRRTDMPLREEHIAVRAVGWGPKSEGIRKIAAELGVGTDALVFLDDNPVETAEVRAACPEVLALTLPADPEAVPAFLDRVWAFDRLVVTAEDRGRADSYQAEHQRRQLRQDALTFAGFIEGLGLVVDVRPAEDADFARLAQLTQRTNQFNTTTRRLQEADLRALVAEPGVRCDVVRTRDRFGDYGVVGLVVHRAGGEAVTVESLILSCRTLGRGVEHQVVAHVGRRAAQHGQPVLIPFRATAKNEPARLFLEAVAGAPEETGREGEVVFRLDHPAAAEVRFRPENTVDVEEKAAAPVALTVADHDRLRALAEFAETGASGAGGTPPVPAGTDSAAGVVIAVLARVLGVPEAELIEGTRIADLGASSLAFVEAAVALESRFGPLDIDVFYEHPTLGSLIAALAPSLREGTAGAQEAPPDFTAVVDAIVANAATAAAAYEHLTQAEVDHIVERAALAALDQHVELAELAVRETGRGLVEDKAVKNLFAVEHVTHSLAGVQTVGERHHDELAGVVEIVEPVGVVCAITPVTSPTAVVVFKALTALKTRNPIIFSFHHLAVESGARAAAVVRDAAVRAGAPPHCVQWMTERSREATRLLMHHDGVALVLATGGNELVKAAHSTGKPAIGVGAGNVPVFVAADADVARAVNDIVLSRTFDHGTSCVAEQTLIVDARVWPAVSAAFDRLHAYVMTAQEKRKLELHAFGAEAGTPECGTAVVNPSTMGRSAAEVARAAGFSVPEETSVLLVEVGEVGPAEPLTRAKPFPALAVLRVRGTEEGIEQAKRVVDFHGRGHSAVVHTRDEGLVRRFGDEVKAVRIIWNAPGAHGGMGDLYNSFLPSLMLACGSYGGNSFAGNVGAANLLNVRRIARRNNNIQWFKVPPKIYFEPGSVRYLADMADVSRVSVVAGPTVAKLGLVEKVVRILRSRPEPVAVQVIDFVEPEPTVDVVRRGAEMMREFQPDTIIGLGGGSSLDAAKVMWLWYEHPEVSFADLTGRFWDIRKRTYAFPKMGERARLVCVPTTSGSGSEVTPFAVVTDPETGTKHALGDYALTPDVAIVDPLLVGDMPARLAADSGFDALTHATEAYVSVFANDFTDGLCLQAIKLIFGYLERSVHSGTVDPEAREKVHNASAIAGMAFGNAFLGIVHAMAHPLGSTYGIAHGRANAVLLPHVIRYNGQAPTKLTGWPKYESYLAPQRFQDIARVLGLPAATPEEGVLSFADAVEDLRTRVGIPESFAALGVDEQRFIADLPRQAVNAYKDQCAPANPRMPVLKDLERLMRDAYYFGTGEANDSWPKARSGRGAAPGFGRGRSGRRRWGPAR